MVSPGGAADWHRFRLGDLKLLLGVRAGSLHVLDEAAWDIVPYLAEGGPPAEAVESLARRHGREESGEALAELQAVREEEELRYRGEPTGGAGGGEPVLKALCLHVSRECNMRCAYCFAAEARAKKEEGMMSPRVARAAVDFLLEASASRRHLEIDFFGGEPLLNFAVIAETVGYAESRAAAAGKDISFALTTNGLLLEEEVCRFLEEHGVGVILSLDGRKEVHDRLRRLASGEGSYEAVAANIRRFAARKPRAGYWVRGTYTRFNLDFTADVVHLLALGFQNISLEPVVARGGGCALREADLPAIETEYERLARLYLERFREGKGFSFFHFQIDLDGGPCLLRRLSGCGAGVEYLAVAPSGRLYPCHQFLGIPEFALGDVRGKAIGDEARRRFLRATVVHKDTCAACWARYHCGGGCHAAAWLFNGDILRPWSLGCAIMRKRLECALAVKAATILGDEAIASCLSGAV